MNILVSARHMDVSDSVRSYIEEKVGKLPRIYDNVMEIEVILDMEGNQPTTEIVARARRKHTFVASHRDETMYASIDGCLDKISEQLRRHKDKVRDRQGPGHGETSEMTSL